MGKAGDLILRLQEGSSWYGTLEMLTLHRDPHRLPDSHQLQTLSLIKQDPPSPELFRFSSKSWKPLSSLVGPWRSRSGGLWQLLCVAKLESFHTGMKK